MRLLKGLVLVVLVLGMASAVPAYADLTGAHIDTKADFPDMFTVFQDGGPATIGPGIEYPIGTFDLYNPNFSIDFTGTQIFISLNGAQTQFQSASFNGFEVDFLSGILTSATVDGSSDFNPVISIIGGNLFLNYQGLSAEGVSVIDINGSVTTTPEPGSLALVGSGVLAMVGVFRRRLNRYPFSISTRAGS